MSVTLEINALDFERLTESSMEMSDDWVHPIQEGRFESNEGFEYAQIYWYENYASAKLATAFLDANDEKYTMNFDCVLCQYVIFSDYVGA